MKRHENLEKESLNDVVSTGVVSRTLQMFKSHPLICFSHQCFDL